MTNMKTEKTSKPYQKIIDNAKTLFMKHGMRRITVEEICKEAGVSKMTFYRIFTNKEDVAEKIIFEINERNMMKYYEIMNQKISYLEKIQQTLELKNTASSEISEEFIKDILQNENELFIKHLTEIRQNANEQYLKDFIEAQKNGDVRKDIKPEFILYILDMLYEKMKDERLIGMYKNTQEATMEITKFFFYGILSRNV